MSFKALVAAVLVIGSFFIGSRTEAQNWTQVGLLKCRLAPTVGLIVGSKQRLSCQFQPSQSVGGMPSNYSGEMITIGIDIGVVADGELAWAVLAPTVGPAPGELAGKYVGASAEATLGLGAGANVLVGGSSRSIALQPLSVQGTAGLNVQLGASELQLTPAL